MSTSAALCMVRLTPAEREDVRATLSSTLGADLRLRNDRTVRVWDSAECALIDAVRFGPRGYTMAMRGGTADKIAAALSGAGRHDLADLFRRRRPVRRAATGSYLPA